MKCPACGNNLEELIIGDLTVDVCRHGCGGIWFDNFELQQVDEKHESAGEQLLEIETDPAIKVDYEAYRYCPRCDGQKMKKHFMSMKREVEVDECPACGGFWLDAGELRQIREQFATDAERNSQANAYFDEIFGDEISSMHEESQVKKEKARKIAGMFRFICPSNYIKGKQDWGAF